MSNLLLTICKINNYGVTAAIMVLVGLFVIHGLGLIREKSDRPSAVKYLPPGLFTMAALLALLQPEFNLAEVSTSGPIH